MEKSMAVIASLAYVMVVLPYALLKRAVINGARSAREKGRTRR